MEAEHASQKKPRSSGDKHSRAAPEDVEAALPALESWDPNGGSFIIAEAQDTDGDGKPDFLDADDDGDRVPTKTELGKGGFTQPRSTDGDSGPPQET